MTSPFVSYSLHIEKKQCSTLFQANPLVISSGWILGHSDTYRTSSNMPCARVNTCDNAASRSKAFCVSPLKSTSMQYGYLAAHCKALPLRISDRDCESFCSMSSCLSMPEGAAKSEGFESGVCIG